MTGPAAPSPSSPVNLARSALPRRVRHILQGFHELASDAFERELTATLNEFEAQAFQNAEQARSNSIQVRWLETLRTVRRTRSDLVPRLLQGLEAQLAVIREDAGSAEAEAGAKRLAGELALIDAAEMDESTTLSEIGSRIEMRHSLPIYLLGQRFGVLAGRPAFDAEVLPVGPQMLCKLLRGAAAHLDISSEHRVLLYRLFERQMLAEYGRLLEVLNTHLIKNGVLPGLQYMPFRSPAPAPRPATDAESSRSTGERPAIGRDHAPPRSTGETPAVGRTTAPVPAYGAAPRSAPLDSDAPLPWLLPGESPLWPNTPPAATAQPAGRAPAAVSNGVASGNAAPPAHVAAGGPAGGAGLPAFEQIRDLLASRRTTLSRLSGGAAAGGPAASGDADGAASAPGTPLHRPAPQEVQHALSLLQPSTATSVNMGGRIVPRTVAHLKQDLLAQLRRGAPAGETPVLPEEDNDTFDLVGMLFDELVKDVRPNSQASTLLTKLQVPLLRVALSDKRFFNDSQHPARQMLNAVAETGAYWLGDDDADGALVGKMQGLVDRTLRDFDGDMGLFESLLKDLSSHLQMIARKAEVAERRHVEAARGKERLALARDRAADAVKQITEGSELPVFTRTLLHQAWTDVMALTSLRHGEQSPAWTQQLDTARRLAGLAKPGAAAANDTEAPALQKDVAESLRQVGYHEAESEAIAKRLIAPAAEVSADDAASRTELLMRMKSASRLGSAERPAKPKAELLTPEVMARVAQIKTLAFGTWFEFAINAQGDRVRRRLSWYSPISGTAMFVNHRGQKIGDTSIEHLAIQMANGQAKLVEEEARQSLLDRAWGAVMRSLSSFGGRAKEAVA
ncbi:MAG TPA: hypothetical protein DCM32_01790 [Xanthomonadaceae bacterium]|nr:hypothetical protein [Xanthomonadaceae bacterium]